MLDKEVGWDGETNTASIDDKVEVSKKDTTSDKSIIQGDAEEVYITETGSRYHRVSCSSLRSSKIAISLEEAKEKYEPCRTCKP